MQAIILAAGQGQRLRDFSSLPKGFLSLGGESLIRLSLQQLFYHRISEVLIITGYGFEHYYQLTDQYPFVSTHYNNQFETYGNLYSLFLAKDWVRENVLILESDIVYEGRALSAIMASSAEDAILTSGFTRSGDEVYVEAQANLLLNMSKDRQSLAAASVIGEFVGISKLSLQGFYYLIDLLEKNLPLLHRGHYDEHGLVELAAHHPIHCVSVLDLLWAEIDDYAHYLRAQKIYAAIQRKEEHETNDSIESWAGYNNG